MADLPALTTCMQMTFECLRNLDPDSLNGSSPDQQRAIKDLLEHFNQHMGGWGIRRTSSLETHAPTHDEVASSELQHPGVTPGTPGGRGQQASLLT